jgi:hypothetical protein
MSRLSTTQYEIELLEGFYLNICAYLALCKLVFYATTIHIIRIRSSSIPEQRRRGTDC